MITEQQAQIAAMTINDAVFGRNASETAIAITKQELLAVNQEEENPTAGRFHKITFDESSRHLELHTGIIELEFVRIGSFRIVIPLATLNSHTDAKYHCSLYAVVRNPYASAHHPHPHISHGHLCFGDGHTAANNALSRGDVMSCARIINAILHTYNRESPYRSIGTYRGPECFDCGGTVVMSARAAQEAKTKEGFQCRCANKVCGNCCLLCSNCSGGICSECHQLYDTSDGKVLLCQGCVVECYSCGRPGIPRLDEFMEEEIDYYGDTVRGYYCSDCRGSR